MYADFFVFLSVKHENREQMAKYYKVYMQKEKSGEGMIETIAEFGMYCMSIPFSIGGTAKNLTERSWAEEDGKDVYVPQKLCMDGYTMKVKFGFKGDKFSANKSISAMMDYLTGRDGSGVYMKLYCDYTKTGRRHVRFTKLSDDATLVRTDDDGDILIVEMEMAVDDPVTEITMAGNNLV